MYVFVYIVFFFLLHQPVLLQQSAFQRALIKNANNVRSTSAATQRHESRRKGEEERFSYPFETECARQREKEKGSGQEKMKKQRQKKGSSKLGEKEEKGRMG